MSSGIVEDRACTSAVAVQDWFADWAKNTKMDWEQVTVIIDLPRGIAAEDLTDGSHCEPKVCALNAPAVHRCDKRQLGT
jgi:hypothetical protein